MAGDMKGETQRGIYKTVKSSTYVATTSIAHFKSIVARSIEQESIHQGLDGQLFVDRSAANEKNAILGPGPCDLTQGARAAPVSPRLHRPTIL